MEGRTNYQNIQQRFENKVQRADQKIPRHGRAKCLNHLRCFSAAGMLRAKLGFPETVQEKEVSNQESVNRLRSG